MGEGHRGRQLVHQRLRSHPVQRRGEGTRRRQREKDQLRTSRTLIFLPSRQLCSRFYCCAIPPIPRFFSFLFLRSRGPSAPPSPDSHTQMPARTPPYVSAPPPVCARTPRLSVWWWCRRRRTPFGMAHLAAPPRLGLGPGGDQASA
eukprot:NODE_6130_length_469_cov_14.050000_g4632_i0.p2 GENE.NODE_6130_length_469_cov_14.050000_g4632_i0~~NODE_6130_length_469_cov_14.050000_g4632_i0.p2  ORF type:complete len:153 (-),score=21.98 NODE_6130_length_469_cov_14.050000_g4632_i0:9-446(-)